VRGEVTGGGGFVGARVGEGVQAARRGGVVAGDWLDRLPTWRVLAAFLVAQWALVVGIAAAVRHNGWIYYQGGDQLWYYTGGWLLAHGHLGQPLVGYLWTMLHVPIAAVAGPNIASGYPAVILFDVLILLPIAVLALFGLARLIGGTRFAYLTVLLWIAMPLIGIKFTDAGYHERFTEANLPQALGLTSMADFPTMVAALVAAYFCARTVLLDRPRLVDAAAGGVAAGAAIAVKPSTALFLLGPALAYLVARRFRPAAVFLAGMLPALLTLALWKYRGYGHLPITSSAMGVSASGVHPLVGGLDTSKYLHFDWKHFEQQLDQIREHFWSVRVVEWVVVGGLIGLGRRSLRALALVGGWFAAFVLVKGGYDKGAIEDGSLIRLLIPAIPPFVLIVASLRYLLPGSTRTPVPEPVESLPSTRTSWLLIGAAVVVTALGPLALIAAASPLTGTPPRAVTLEQPLIPYDIDTGLRAAAHGSTVALHWQAAHPRGGAVFYHVYRTPAEQAGYTCLFPAPPAEQCTLSDSTDLGATRSTSFVDTNVPPGAWAYRIGVAANWLNDTGQGDVYLLSSGARARVRP
jgi:hypothetical protein